MAVSRKTQKDVGKFEAKFIGPFTTTQTIFVVIGAVLALLVKFLMDAIGAPIEVTIVLIVVVVAPCIFLGWKKFYGMPALEYIKVLYDKKYKNPGRRLYKTETDIDEMKGGKFAEPQQPKKKIEHRPSREFPSYR